MQNNDPLSIELRKHKLRMSATRRGIYESLRSAERPMTVQELVATLPGSHFVSVYRSVDAMYKAGLLRLVPQGFKNRYELGDVFLPHHHHVTCEDCGISYEINHKRIEEAIEELSLEAGLKPTRHHVELYGVCKECPGDTLES